MSAIDDLYAPRPRLRAASIALVLFGIVSLLTALFITTSAGRAEYRRFEAGVADKIMGPIAVEATGGVLHIEVRQAFATGENAWAFVGGELLDADLEFLMGFGEEVWSESGYESGYYWAESKLDFDLNLTVPESGQFYVKFDIEESAPNATGELAVSVEPRYGSGVPHFATGLFALLFGLVMLEVSTAAVRRALAEAG